MSKRMIACGSLALLLLAGCSQQVSVYKTTGKVLYQGQPAVGALVRLYPLTEDSKLKATPRGTVGADGTFALTTFAKDDGAPAGEYAVTIDWRQPISAEEGAETEYGPNVVPQFADPKVTTLRAKVEATSSNELPPYELAP